MNERIEKLLEHVCVNEQIERLAKQAGCSIDRMGFGEGNLEKFAELIVRECCLQVADVRIENEFELVGDAVLVQALVGIKRHFGVE